MFKEIIRRKKWYDSTKLGRCPKYSNRGGDVGERKVLDFCKNKFPYAESIHHSIRIPDPNSHQSKGEVDVILCLPKAVFFLEVKHWKGKIDADENNEIFQVNGSKKEVCSIIQRKSESAKKMFLSKFNESIGDIYPLVVLTHDKCHLSDRVKNLNNVVSLRDLFSRIKKLENYVEDDVSKKLRIKRTEMFNSFGTWDFIEFQNKSMLIGDVKNFNESIDRKKIKSFRTYFRRGLISTIIRGPLIDVEYYYRDGSKVIREIKPEYVVNLNIPWESNSTKIPMEEISLMTFGYKDDIDWLESIRVNNGEKKKRKQRKKKPNQDELNKRYKLGQKLIGTIIHQIPDKDDEKKIVGLLVSIVENQVKGLVPKQELPFQEFMPLFQIGNEIEVEITSINKNGLRFKLIND